MRERITPEDTFFERETCKELGIEYGENPYEEDFISEDEIIRIIEKEHELAVSFLGRYESTWWEGIEDSEYEISPPFIKFHQEEKTKIRKHNKIEYKITEGAFGLWVDFESIMISKNDIDLNMGCISGSRLRFINEVEAYGKEKDWKIDYKNKKVWDSEGEVYVDKNYIDKIYIQKKLK